MSLKLIVNKLELSDKKFISKKEVEIYCRQLDLNYYRTIRYLTHYDHLVRILRGIFYIKSIEERKLKKIDISYLEAIKEALKIKGVKNWYFGLDTALKFNNLTHEYFVIDYIINDRIFRAKPILIMGHKIRFIKVNHILTTFGLIRGNFSYSDIEKTVLDFFYLKEHGKVRLLPKEFIKICSRSKLLKYLKYYDKRTAKKLKEAL